MGNTKSRDGLKRNDSKRHSKRARNEDNQKMMGEASKAEIESTQLQTKGNDSSEEKYFQKLGKSLNQHEVYLESFVSVAEAQKGMVDGLVKLLAEKTEENADNAPQEKSILPDVMKDAADILRKMQKPCQLHTNSLLTNSFLDIRRDIKECLGLFGKDTSVIDIKHRKQVSESSQEGNIEEQMKRQKETIEKQEKINEEIQRQNRILQNEIKQYRPANVSATVQLFHTLNGKLINEIEKELKTMLTSKLGTVNFISCRSASDIDDKKLVIVLCIVSTRLGADAATAIKDLKNPGNASLLIIHIAEAHSLPDQKSSRSLTDLKFKNLRHIDELAFKSGNGFFQCEMNERSIDELCSFCKAPTYGNKL